MVDNLEMGINEATKSIDKGTALSKLNELIKFSEEINEYFNSTKIKKYKIKEIQNLKDNFGIDHLKENP